MYSQEAVDRFVAVLKSRGLLPAQIEFFQIGDLVGVNALDEHDGHIISNGTCTGIDRDPQTALMKALTEWVERRALDHSFRHGGSSDFRQYGSDGTAAFPRIAGDGPAEIYARENAYCEALERFVWATWWEETEFNGAVAVVDNSSPELRKSLGLFNLIQKTTPLQGMLLVKPYQSDAEREVVIIFSRLRSGGWLSGGAAGRTGNTAEVVFRGMSEMARHSLAYARMLTGNAYPETFYEKRLHYFASGCGNTLVDSRLSRVANGVIELPALALDARLSHPHEDIAVAHRVLFEGQPLFIGGAMERLCL